MFRTEAVELIGRGFLLSCLTHVGFPPQDWRKSLVLEDIPPSSCGFLTSWLCPI